MKFNTEAENVVRLKQMFNAREIPMVTKAQIEFFNQLLGEKDFGDKDTEKLAKEFSKLDKVSASAWIDKALTLDKLDAASREVVQPAF